MNRMNAAVILSALALTTCAGLLVAGPLTPPAGAIAPSFKTLTEVEPRIAINAVNTPGDADSVFKITQPGSYYLAGNVQGASGKNGIKIVSQNVTVDLNGFNVLGGSGSFNGVLAYPMSRVVLRNGVVSAWAGNGVVVGAGSTVSDVIVDHCGQAGISATQDCSILRCNAISNGGVGISVYRGANVVECHADSNSGDGIATYGAAAVSRCTAQGNAQSGISAASGTSVLECLGTANIGDGITAADQCTISGNTCVSNGDDGIQLGGSCLVTRNQCTNNDTAGDGAGLYILGTSNRVDDNVVIANHFGVLCPGTDNFIVKNTSRGNSGLNFSVSGGNEFAPVITNPGANSFATMTAWSNVAY